MKHRNVIRCKKFLALALISVMHVPSIAAATRTLEEVIVTAERRETSIQDTPLVITALTSEAIDRQPFTDIISLGQRVPALVFTQRNGVLQTTIRGIGGQEFSLGADPRVAFHSDGVYTARGAAQLSSLYDVERMEIVQGPQGTLYGRNATAGAINVITRAPSTEAFSGYITEAIGNYDLYKTNAAINVPLSDEWAVRVAGELIDRDGYGDNVYRGQDIDNQDSEAVRARVRWERETFIADLIANYYRRDDNSFPLYYTGWIQTPITPNPPAFINDNTIIASDERDLSADYPLTFKNKTDGVALKLFWELSDTLSVQSLTGYLGNDYLAVSDSDTTNVVAGGGSSREDSDTFSQELQLNGNFERLQFTAGLYYFEEEVKSQVRINASTLSVPISIFYIRRGLTPPPSTEYVPVNFADAKLDTQAYAAFAQATYAVTDDFRVTVGGRYTEETKKVQRGFQGLNILEFPLPVYEPLGQNYSVPKSYYQPEEDKTWTKFTPNLHFQYDISADAMAYLTYSEGFKSGTYGLADPYPPVDPEELKDYEGGIKANWLDDRLRTNLGVFYYDYTNMQVSVFDPSALVLSTQNAAKATAYGIQLDTAAQVTSELSLRADAILLSSEFDQFTSADSGRLYLGPLDLKGNDLPQSPEYKVSLSANYVMPLGENELALNLQATFTDKFYLTPFEQDTHSSPSSHVYDASLEYRMANGLKASIWGNNLSDELLITSVFPSSPLFGNAIQTGYGAPRTYGVQIGYEW